MRRRWVPPVIDLLCILAFVVIGRDRHQVSAGAYWVFRVWWPLALGWSVAALATRLYTRGDRMWVRLAGTIVGGVLLGGIFRWAFTQRVAYSVFTVVALVFLSLVTFGWRLIARLVARRRGAPSAPTPA